MTRTRLRNYWLLSMISVGTAIAVSVILLLGFRWQADRDILVQETTVQSQLIAANLSAAIAFNDVPTANEIVATLEHASNVVEAAVYRADGSLMVRFLRQGASSRLGDRAPGSGHDFSLSDLRLTAPILIEQKVVGTISLRVSLASHYASLARFLGGMAAITLIAMVIGLIATRGLRQRMAAAELQLERLAMFDGLTGLANRHAFGLALASQLDQHQHGGGSALLFIDVDGFKKINDSFGHRAGDLVLAEVGERMRKALRGNDVIGRVGGDEFGVILTNTNSPEAAAHVAETLLKTAADPMTVEGRPAHVSLSIGIAMLPHDADDADSAMRNADLAMYHAKRLGRNNHQFYSSSLGNVAKRRLEIEAGLRTALDTDELYVAYQPQRSSTTGRIVGMEALVRWRHPDWGIISPMEFIPIAEDCGLIHRIGRLVLDHVCRDIVELRGSGLVVPPVAVNASALELAREDFPAQTLGLLRKYGLETRAIEVELTETVLMNQVEESRAVIDKLAANDIEIAIDDFGTGYSSLTYLHQLPVKTLKLDMGFTRKLPDNTETVSIVKGMIDMAHALRLRVVAEGVESAIQAECLRNISCDVLQGYHIGLPMRKQEVMLFLDAA